MRCDEREELGRTRERNKERKERVNEWVDSEKSAGLWSRRHWHSRILLCFLCFYAILPPRSIFSSYFNLHELRFTSL